MSDQSHLHILAICSRPLLDPGGQPISLLDVAEERRRVGEGLAGLGGAARVRFLSEATTGQVQAALRDGWDVVHFTGHGTDDGRLVLEDGFGVAHFLTKQETAQLFTGALSQESGSSPSFVPDIYVPPGASFDAATAKRRPPLVVLSACYSETIGRELHAAGVPAVVAVDARVPIADLAAIIFAEHFYGALARGWDVCRAFEDAQRAVALDPKVGDSRPPRDAQGKAGEPWSRRFKLIGDAQGVATGRVAHRDAAARAPVAGNLRSGSASFVGRAKEIVSVVKAFDENDERRVCVYGSGGLGKTELSKAVARWYAERERAGAVLWVSASHVEGDYKLRDLASLLGIAASVFGLPVTEQSMFEEQKAVVRAFLADARALVLLDNWETIERQHRRELWDFALSLPDTVRVLVTSRDVLPAKDARNIELDTLAPDDAVKLFVEIARNTHYFDRNPDFGPQEQDILHAICERLSGYPLAIEVVAGQTFSRTLTEIWADLQRVPRDVLEGKDELTGEPRGVWTSLNLSYDALPPDEQSLFRQMCVLLSPAATEDIAAITQTPNPRAALDTLVKRSLVRAREGAYSLLPIVRVYAEGKLTDAGQDPRELHRHAVNHYGNKNTLEDALTASDHLFELAARFEVREAAEAFLEYVPGFYQALVMRGYWAKARSKTVQLIVLARALDNKQTEAHAISELGVRHYQIGEYDHAAQLQRMALGLLEEVADKRGAAFALHQLGMLAHGRGDYEEASRLYRQSLGIREELGDEIGIAATLHQLGMLAQASGDLDEATRLYRRSLEIEEKLGNKAGIADTLHQLGILARKRGDHGEATRLYRRSLEIVEKLGNKAGIADTLHQLGILARERGDHGEATRLFRRSLEIEEGLGNKRGIAISLHELGNMKLLEKDYDEAARLYGQSLDIRKELGDRNGIAEVLAQLGHLSRAQGRTKEALSYFLRAFVIFEELRAPYQRLVLTSIGSVREAVGNEQFGAWMRELSIEAERMNVLLEHNAEQQAKEIIAQQAHAVVVARKQGSAEERATLAQQLAQAEAGARGDGVAELADYYAVLRGLLAGEDVAEKIAALDEPFKRVAELVRSSCE